MNPRKCIHCGRLISASRHHKAMLCSDRCRNAHRREYMQGYDSVHADERRDRNRQRMADKRSDATYRKQEQARENRNRKAGRKALAARETKSGFQIITVPRGTGKTRWFISHAANHLGMSAVRWIIAGDPAQPAPNWIIAGSPVTP